VHAEVVCVWFVRAYMSLHVYVHPHLRRVYVDVYTPTHMYI